MPDDAAVNAYYEKNKSNFMTPETVALKYIELKVDDIAAQVKVSDEALATYYESVKDRYVERSGGADGTSSSRCQAMLKTRLLARKPRTSWPR